MTKTKALPVRIPAEMIERFDEIRNPLIPRESFIRDLLDKALKAQERTQRYPRKGAPMRGIIITAAVVASLVFAGTANAVIHSPVDGSTVQLTDTVYFDWSWAPDEYDTAWVGFASSPDGPWSPRPARTVQDCSYGVCGDWLSSHASIPATTITVGTWYWRVCNHSINIEDDKCQYGADPATELTVSPPPPPPPTITTPPTITAPPTITTPTTPTTPALPTLTQSAATGDLKTALRSRFNMAFQARGYQASCRRSTRTSFTCHPRWGHGGYGYSGPARIWLSVDSDGVSWNYSFRVTRTSQSCVRLHRARCTKTYVVK